MTPEQQNLMVERVAVAETEIRQVRADITEMKEMLRVLVNQANMGRGALWVFMAVGGVIVSIATWVIQHIRLDPT